jgi:hypothetical protein
MDDYSLIDPSLGDLGLTDSTGNKVVQASAPSATATPVTASPTLSALSTFGSFLSTLTGAAASGVAAYGSLKNTSAKATATQTLAQAQATNAVTFAKIWPWVLGIFSFGLLIVGLSLRRRQSR